MTLTAPTLVDPIVIEYRAGGPYEVVAGTQWTDGRAFPNDRDLLVLLPEVVSRPRGLTLRGGRNVVIKGGQVSVSQDYTTVNGESNAVANRAVYLDHRTTGTVHVEGLLLDGAFLYEGINTLGTEGTSWQFTNCLVKRVNWYPTGNEGVGSDHDGGDCYQPLRSWASIKFDGVEFQSGQYQGLFCKREPNFVSGPIDVRRVAFTDYRGPGAVLYSNPGEDVAVTGGDVYVQPGRTSYATGVGTTDYRTTTKPISELVYGSMTNLTVTAGAPPAAVYAGVPGMDYVTDEPTGPGDTGGTVLVQGVAASPTSDLTVAPLPARTAGQRVQVVVRSQGVARSAVTGGYDPIVVASDLTVWQSPRATGPVAAGGTFTFRVAGTSVPFAAFAAVL